MSRRDAFRDLDVISGAVLAGLGVYIFMQARQWVYYGSDGPGPGFFPTWYGVAMMALSLLLIGSKIKNHSDVDGTIEWKGAGRALATWAAFAGSALLLKPLGFTITFALLTFFIVKVIFRRSSPSAVITAVCTVAVFALTFPMALGVSLPAGVLGF
jgi:putative tricarboxylic transport membrane protein